MITSLTATRTGPTTWRLNWTSDETNPTFYVYRDGVLIAQTTAVEWEVTVPAGGAAPVFEVLDADDEPTQGYPATVVLAWYAAAGAASYRVEQLDGVDWVEQAEVTDDGLGYLTWQSGTLADGTTHEFRVIPVGSNGNDGTAQAFDVLMVRYPDPPAPTIAYDPNAGTATLS